MKRGILILLICSSLFLSCAERKAEHVEVVPSQTVAVDSTPQDTRSSARVAAEEKATKLAKGAAKRFFGSLEKYEVITRETDEGWHVAVHLKEITPTIAGGAAEFFIDEEGEKI